MKKALLIGIIAVVFPAMFRVECVAQNDVQRIETISLRGVFIDTEKQPVAGAAVNCNNLATTTDERGGFSFEFPADNFNPYLRLTAHLLERQLLGELIGLPERPLLLGASRYGEEFIPFFEEGKTELAPITLESLPQATEVNVTVVDAEGKPVEGATVGASPMYTLGKTDAKGQFAYLSNLAHGGVRSLSVFKPGVGAGSVDQSRFFGHAHVDREKLPPYTNDFHFKLDSRTVKVRVVDEEGHPLEGTTVEAESIRQGDVGGFYTGDLRRHYRAGQELTPWQSKTDAEGIAAFDWIPQSNLTGIIFTARGGWNAKHPAEANLVAFGGWGQEAKLIVNAAYWDLENYDRNAEKNEWEQLDWQKIFDDIPVIKVAFQPAAPEPSVASAKITVKRPDGTPVAWYPFQSQDDTFGYGTTNINGELTVSGVPHSRYILTAVGKTGTAPSMEFEFGDEATEKRIDVVLQKGTKLYGNVTRADGASLDSLEISVWELREDSEPRILRKPFLTRHPEPAGPYAILLPPGKFEIEARSRYTYTRSSHTTTNSFGKDEWLFGFNKTLIIDGSEDAIELDIVLKEVGRE